MLFFQLSSAAETTSSVSGLTLDDKFSWVTFWILFTVNSSKSKYQWKSWIHCESIGSVSSMVCRLFWTNESLTMRTRTENSSEQWFSRWIQPFIRTKSVAALQCKHFSRTRSYFCPSMHLWSTHPIKYDRMVRLCAIVSSVTRQHWTSITPFIHPWIQSFIHFNYCCIFSLYTRSECLLDCRLKNVIKLCGCIPVAYSDLYDAPDCLLDDFNCLSIWIKQWMRGRGEFSTAKNDENLLVDPKCPDCLRKCYYVKYISTTSKAFFDPDDHNRMSERYSYLWVKSSTSFLSILNHFVHTHATAFHSNRHNLRGHSIVHINFKHNRVLDFEKTVIYTWFDLFGIFGGLCGLTFGGSIISVIELIYFGTGRFGAQFTWKKRRREMATVRPINNNNDDDDDNSNQCPTPSIPSTTMATRPPTVSIYFNELIHYKSDFVKSRPPLRRAQRY